MNNDTKRRVALACVALGAYAACADAPPEAQPYEGTHELERMDYARPATIEDASDYEVRVATTRPPRAARSQRAPRGRGEELPPAHVIACESGGDYRAENASSTASGRYQIVDGSWDGYGGYSHAADAPPEVQDAKARQMWAGGAGWRHWRSCL